MGMRFDQKLARIAPYAVLLYVTLKKEWKTTKRPEGPTGRPYSGTFRDVSMIYHSPEFIDYVDDTCIRDEITRSEFFERLKGKDDWDHVWSEIERIYSITL